ncbi:MULTISPECIES: dihydrodipicolinate synthase family protein [Metallosphaera]|uniref:Aldolase n=1 Tax=Metallosphaera prunae TaxID=47304 RepID=A0A4D8RY96_METPR|nr:MULTISPECIES: dihydrodipicolinate synthase family protein [Metallosphaera]QCO29110.1 aldolase [Metallosphaera prunae]BBL47311.1 4-hydroxy-tetrahydrodipicolinate synthase [Metallosphaera sedula]
MALPPTPATDDASNPKIKNTVDVRESRRLIENLIKDGVDGIAVNGTLGEMATLTEHEWQTFAKTVVETVKDNRPDLPLFVGATTLNTRDTLRRIEYLVDELKHYGVFLGRPMWCEMSPEAIVGYYKSIVDVYPEISIMLYDNPEAFKGPIPTKVYKTLAEKVPQIVAAKYIALTPKFYEDLRAVGSNIKLLPLEVDWLPAYLYSKDVNGTWSSSAACGPEPVIALRNAIFKNDLESAIWLTNRIRWTYETFLAFRDFREFSRYNIPIEKVRFNECGYVKAGPARPPYDYIPPEYEELTKESGRRWRILVKEVNEKGLTHNFSLKL